MKLKIQKKGPNLVFYNFNTRQEFTSLVRSSVHPANMDRQKYSTAIGMHLLTNSLLFSLFVILIIGPLHFNLIQHRTRLFGEAKKCQ